MIAIACSICVGLITITLGAAALYQQYNSNRNQ